MAIEQDGHVKKLLSKVRKSSAKAVKTNFFGQKTATTALVTLAENQYDEEGSDNSNQAMELGTPSAEATLTPAYLTKALETLTNKLVATWQQTADSIKKDIQDLRTCTAHLESKMDDYASAYNLCLRGSPNQAYLVTSMHMSAAYFGPTRLRLQRICCWWLACTRSLGRDICRKLRHKISC
ncbi:Hypothetical predicted protein [Pelobates cultripes]|uniref:Uncharacterized protein n=1 Tax=Pelobates cultripes TaxID=61616 RepID=A0AAD1RS97_PELCU|nr:Hypothetical predicted protein [Pelobates cultripes]